MKKVLPYFLAALLILSTLNHIIYPGFYDPIIPEFIPKALAHVFAVVAEGIIGIALLIPNYRKWGGLGFCLLMVVFLPLHVWDMFRENPALGSTAAAAIRLVIQFVLIYTGWWLWKRE